MCSISTSGGTSDVTRQFSTLARFARVRHFRRVCPRDLCHECVAAVCHATHTAFPYPSMDAIVTSWIAVASFPCHVTHRPRKNEEKPREPLYTYWSVGSEVFLVEKNIRRIYVFLCPTENSCTFWILQYQNLCGICGFYGKGLVHEITGFWLHGRWRREFSADFNNIFFQHDSTISTCSLYVVNLPDYARALMKDLWNRGSL